jgi:hypothetical protein
MAVSKRLRHEIFRRDNHTCQSCGAKAPDVKLEPDHVIPVTLGGSDDPSNLQTLCEGCNAGKSATPPDASKVAQVAADAERWAKAMEAAAGNRIGVRRQRDEARAAFDVKWTSWSEGRPPLPRPLGWEVSVDSLLKAGLPVEALLDCVDIAMSRRHVRAGDVFKYMCGVAWKEVRQLQKEAQALIAPGGAVADAPDEVVDLWEEAITDLFDTLTPDEQRRHDISSERLLSLDLDEDERYPVATAFDAVLCDLRSDLWTLSYAVDLLLRKLPDGIGEQAMKNARHEMYDRLSRPELFSRHRFAEWAIYAALHLLKDREAIAYLDTLSDVQRQAWIEYAETVHNAIATEDPQRFPWGALDEGERIRGAAHHAHMAEENRTHKAMCQGPGDVIPACSRRASFLAIVEESRCCHGQTLETHGHTLCEPHLGELVEGTFHTPGGGALTLRDYKEYVIPVDEDPPF